MGKIKPSGSVPPSSMQRAGTLQERKRGVDSPRSEQVSGSHQMGPCGPPEGLQIGGKWGKKKQCRDPFPLQTPPSNPGTTLKSPRIIQASSSIVPTQIHNHSKNQGKENLIQDLQVKQPAQSLWFLALKVIEPAGT